MREIKFNYWDSKNKIMYQNTPYLAVSSWGTVSELAFHEEYLEWVGTDYTKHITPLQYTGYKDVEENEVYEGDIYSSSRYAQGKEELTYWIVTWNESEHGFNLVANLEKSYRGEKYREDVYLPLRAIKGRRMKRAGNIYENPELVKQQAKEG